MKNKTLEFMKNGAISTVSFMAGGIAGAELADLVADSEAVVSVGSTVSQYAAGYGAFMGLHARDNQEAYKQKGRWCYKKLAVDTAKMALSLGVAEIPYVIGRTALMDYFLSKDFGSTQSSIMADLVSLPVFFLVALPLAKKSGLIKKTGSSKKG